MRAMSSAQRRRGCSMAAQPVMAGVRWQARPRQRIAAQFVRPALGRRLTVLAQVVQDLVDHRPGVWAAESVEAKGGPSEDSFCRIRRPIAVAMGQEDGEKWTAAADLQPTILLPPRLPGPAERPHLIAVGQRGRKSQRCVDSPGLHQAGRRVEHRPDGVAHQLAFLVEAYQVIKLGRRRFCRDQPGAGFRCAAQEFRADPAYRRADQTAARTPMAANTP